MSQPDEPVRYSFVRSDQTLAVMIANPAGEYTEWVDYDALLRRCAELEQMVEKAVDEGSRLTFEQVAKRLDGGRFGYTDERDPRYKINHMYDLLEAAKRVVEAARPFNTANEVLRGRDSEIAELHDAIKAYDAALGQPQEGGKQ